MSNSIGDALDRAIEILENELPSRGRSYDWRKDVELLVGSDAFTARQAAAIVGRDIGYVNTHARNTLGKGRADTRRRTLGGVAGNLNLDSLKTIRYLRARWAMHQEGRQMQDTDRTHLAAVVEAGNGASMVAHLTGIPVSIVRRAIEKGDD